MTRGRPRKCNPKDVLEVAMRSFWLNGYHEISLNDLSKVTGMAKPGFYSNFGDKEGLFQKALENYSEQIAEPMLADIMELPESTINVFRTFFFKMASTVTSSNIPNGCFISASFLECAQFPDKLRSVTLSLMDRQLVVFRNRIESALQLGELDQSTDVESLAQFLSSQTLAITGMARAGKDILILTKYIDIALSVLNNKSSTLEQ